MNNKSNKNSTEPLPKKAVTFHDLIAKNPNKNNTFKANLNQNLKSGGAKFNPSQFKTQHKGGQ